MALSNWDTLAVGLNGEPHDGTFVSPGGVGVSIYRNWIYIRDPEAWRKGGSFCDSTIMEIQNGEIRYHDVLIHAIRGPQNGVYVACWHIDYDVKPADYSGMIGCGVYGFDNEDWVGVTSKSVEFLQKWISKKRRTWEDEEIEEFLAHDKHVDADAIRKEWSESYSFDFPEEIAGVSLDLGVRYNQGDMYFADNAGTPLGESKPGEAKEPVITDMIAKMDFGNKEPEAE